jgi:hypothetical protein
MGEVASVVKAFSCEACAKYVFNSCHFHSQCMRSCCVIEFTTDEIGIPEDDSDMEFEVEGCCMLRKHA